MDFQNHVGFFCITIQILKKKHSFVINYSHFRPAKCNGTLLSVIFRFYDE